MNIYVKFRQMVKLEEKMVIFQMLLVVLKELMIYLLEDIQL
jgi:hypothetical protein